MITGRILASRLHDWRSRWCRDCTISLPATAALTDSIVYDGVQLLPPDITHNILTYMLPDRAVLERGNVLAAAALGGHVAFAYAAHCE